MESYVIQIIRLEVPTRYVDGGIDNYIVRIARHRGATQGQDIRFTGHGFEHYGHAESYANGQYMALRVANIDTDIEYVNIPEEV